jgi:single-stranded DNA-binding protein
MNAGLTGCKESVRGFLGRKPVIKTTNTRQLAAYFDVSWGIQDPDNGKHATWRHCIAYGKNAELVKDCRPGAYLNITGWITTNPVYGESGSREHDAQGKPVTKEYLIVDSIFVKHRDNIPDGKQLSLVE